RREVLMPDFCGDMQFAPRKAGGGNGRADGVLIAVHFRGVDVPVAQGQCALDRRAAGLALHAKSAEPEPRQADALCVKAFHENSPKERRIAEKTGDKPDACGKPVISRKRTECKIKIGLEAARKSHCSAIGTRFQLQMPPDLQGQVWMRRSIACAWASS